MELFRSFEGGLVDPADVLHIVAVESVVFALLLPGNLVCPFNTVLRLSRNSCNSAEGDSGSRSVHVKLAFDAG